jgi:hypothetical protein
MAGQKVDVVNGEIVSLVLSGERPVVPEEGRPQDGIMATRRRSSSDQVTLSIRVSHCQLPTPAKRWVSVSSSPF